MQELDSVTNLKVVMGIFMQIPITLSEMRHWAMLTIYIHFSRVCPLRVNVVIYR